jgi:hypothetical protein
MALPTLHSQKHPKLILRFGVFFFPQEQVYAFSFSVFHNKAETYAFAPPSIGLLQ